MSRPADAVAPAPVSELPRNVIDAIERSPGVNTQAAEPILRIHILGEMRATTYLGDEVLPRGRKARAILGCLCLAAGARLKRRSLAAMLWDRVPPHQASASFRQAFRELIVPLGPLANELILADRDTIRLNTGACWIDALAVQKPAPSPTGVPNSLTDLCNGELLEKLDDVSDSFGRWLVGERAHFVEKLRASRECRKTHDANPEAAARAEIARRLIGFGPTYEGAYRVLMRALADLGQPAQALGEYFRCEQALRSMLDVAPSPETRALHDAIRLGLTSGQQGAHEFANGQAVAQPSVVQQQAANRSRLRVAVLPFRTSDPSLSTELAVQLSQEVANQLSRFRWFQVIDPRVFETGQIASAARADFGRHNEPDYVIDGELSATALSHRVDVRLLELTHPAAPIWTSGVDLSADAPFHLNEVTSRIVEQIDPVILFIEGQRRERHGATGQLLRAISLMYTMKRTEYEEAGSLLRKALEEEPGNAKIAAWAAHWQVFHVGQGWSADPAQALATARSLALKAIEIDSDNAEAVGIYGHICAFLEKDFDAALRHFDRSLRLNPNVGYIWALSAVARCYVGEPDEALARMDRYRDLAPYDPYFSFFEGVYAIAYILKGEFARAAAVGRRMVEQHPEFSNAYKPLIAALGHLGLLDEARPYVVKLLELEPRFTVAHFGKTYPFRYERDRERYMDGLRRAGVPEQ